MRKLTAALLLGSVLVAGVMAAPALYAQDGRSMMGHGMMGDTKGEGGMRGMMGTMKQMSEMADHCSSMMSDSAKRPNEQWRKESPSEPEKKG